ncbi:MAG: hypothetical protein ABIN36_07415 [Ferruginibacter sp.]
MITTSIEVIPSTSGPLYDLQLIYPIGTFRDASNEKNLIYKKNLDNIPDFEKKLEYFNKNICSLSVFTMAGQIYWDWQSPGEKMKIYCGCFNCRKTGDFSADHQQIYFKLRDKEVKRITKKLRAAKTYKDKLQFLFTVEGYNPNTLRQVYENIPYDPVKNPDTAFFSSIPVFDPSPETKDQIAEYNEFVWAAFDKKYKDISGFTKQYKAFNADYEIERLTAQLKRSLDPHNLLLHIRNIIFTFFKYPQCLTLKEESQNVKYANDQLEQMSFGQSLFPKMFLGNEIDLNRFVLDESNLMHYTHVSEIIKYYRFLESRIQERYVKNNETMVLPNKKKLSELAIDNAKYKRLVEYYYDKVKLATGFIDKTQFITEEREKIESEFLQPIPMKAGNLLTEFSLEGYSRLAFDSLRSGVERDIETSLNKAKLDFLHYRRRTNPNFSEINNADEIEQIAHSAFAALERGVAFLLYYKFLNDPSVNKKEPKAKPQTDTTTLQQSFEDIFYDASNAEKCLKILRELQPPVIDALNNYIGKSKGILPLWLKVLKNHKPEPLIKHFGDMAYKNILNNTLKGLNLSKDASEFRKQYVRLNSDKVELDIKTLLSQVLQ